MTCLSARNVILQLVRGSSTEAERLRLEQHLSGCHRCRAERAQWSLVERVREQPVRSLGTQARARVLRNLVAEAAAPREAVAAPPRSVRAQPWAVAAAAMVGMAAMLAVAAKVVANRRGGEPVLVAAGQLLGGEQAGAARIEGARLWYASRSAVRLAGARRLELVEGEVEVEVTPGGAERFRVYAPRFIVEVVGTRFVVNTGGMRTLHGVVRVLGRDERELAVVRAGQSWSAGAPAVVAVVPVAVEAAARPVAAMQRNEPVVAAQPPKGNGDFSTVMATAPRNAASQRAVAVGGARVEGESRAGHLLLQATSALGRGKIGRARQLVAAALAAGPLPLEHATADLLSADAERLAGATGSNAASRSRALASYRLVAERWSHLPQGEQALFMIAQLQCERGTPADARAALDEYLARYPSGAFQREAEGKLAELRSSP